MADFQLGPAASENLKKFVKCIEPYGIKGAQGTTLRRTGFSKADGNGSGMVSLAETENFVLFALSEQIDDEDEQKDLFKCYRKCFKYAFDHAKNLGKSSGKVLTGAKTATADDYISFAEFRMFCVYLTVSAAMYDVFTLVDGGDEGVTEDDDSRISLEEFLSGYKVLGGLGFKALGNIDSDEKATELFHSVDTNHGGFILFKEWADYIKKEEIKEKTHIGTLLSGDLKASKIPSSGSSLKSTPSKRSASIGGRNMTSSGRKKVGSSVPSSVHTRATVSSSSSPNTNSVKSHVVVSPEIDGVFKPRNTTKELKDFLKSIQPYAEKSAEAKKLRQAGFRKCDGNGSGECSLAEIDGFVLENLKADYGEKLGPKLFKQFRPAYIVAYNAAKAIKASARGNDDDYINFSEFRLLNVYLCIYACMLDAFSTADGGGAGVTANDDRRVDEKEWVAAFNQLRTRAFKGLNKLKNEDEALSAFHEIDSDGSGKVLFRDFCEYLASAEVESGTKVASLFEGKAMKTLNTAYTLEQ